MSYASRPQEISSREIHPQVFQKMRIPSSGKQLRSWYRALLLASTLLFAGLVSQASMAQVSVVDLHTKVATLNAEIEQIRQVMGIRPPRERTFELVGAVPRQIYFQARTLVGKCNVLAQQVAGVSRQTLGPAPDRELTLDDVDELVSAAGAQLAIVKSALGVTEPVAEPRVSRRVKPEETLRDIIEAGYVINQLSADSPDWAQIYDRVYQMITYVGGVLPEESRYPELEPYVCCRQGEAVYVRLVATMEAARDIAAANDLVFIRIVPGKRAEGGASPATVYDLTTTLISDFGELTLRMGGDDIDGPAYERPTRILPSHVYQLASGLEQQIQQLNKL